MGSGRGPDEGTDEAHQMTSINRRLIIGPGGTGRTHRLRMWEAELDEGATVSRISGHPARQQDETIVQEAMASNPDVLVIDDLQWLAPPVIDAIIEVVGKVSVWASRRPWPSNGSLRLLDDVLTEEGAAERVGLLEFDDFASTVSTLIGKATSNTDLETLFEATAGLIGLAADAVAANWFGDLSAVPEELVDAFARRIERAGSDSAALAKILAIDPELDSGTAIDALPDGLDRSSAERGIRAGGLVDREGLLIPALRVAVVADLTTDDRAEIHDRLALSLNRQQPDQALHHLLSGSGTVEGTTQTLIEAAHQRRISDPTQALALAEQAQKAGVAPEKLATTRAEASFALGSPETLRHLGDIPEESAELAAVLGFGIDQRDLRFVQASKRPLLGELADPLLNLARILIAEPYGESATKVRSPQRQLFDQLGDGLSLVVGGSSADALALFVRASDDFDRIKPEVPVGVTPHTIGGTAALLLGDVVGADVILTQAVDANSGGQGEAVTHRFLLAYARLVAGEYSESLEAVRDGEGEGWPHRDRFLLAVLDAALARRSGDTTRLRDAWARAEPVLVRQSGSWLLNDLFIELLAAGARVGDYRRVEPVAQTLIEQGLALPSAGPGPTSARWLELQLALSREDKDGVIAAAEAMSSNKPDDPRAKARIAASSIWAKLMVREVDEEAVVAVSEQLGEVGDDWEASRILGQAALDLKDPAAARRMLELARARASEPTDDSGDGLIVLGLSEREAEVARLIVEGRTHKECGAQLFISPKTVEHHVARIRQKLGATSRAELLATIRQAVETGS